MRHEIDTAPKNGRAILQWNGARHLVAVALLGMIAVGLYHRGDLSSVAAPLSSEKRGKAIANSIAGEVLNAPGDGSLEPSIALDTALGRNVGQANLQGNEGGGAASLEPAPSTDQPSGKKERDYYNTAEQVVAPGLQEAPAPNSSDTNWRELALRLMQELAEARNLLSEGVASYRQAIEEERAHSASLERELGERQRNDSLRQLSSDAGSVKETASADGNIDGRSIEAERTAALEISKIKALLDMVSDNAIARPEPEKQADQKADTNAAARDDRSSESPAAPEGVPDGTPPVPPAPNLTKRASVQPAPSNLSASAPLPPTDLTALLSRAMAHLNRGDIGAARSILEHASERGSAQASFVLAETFDPKRLSAWKTHGTRGDVEKARELYAKAYAGGIIEAAERMRR